MRSKLSWSKLKGYIFNNLILKIASVIFAAVLWLLVINIDDPQVNATIKNVPVTILNETAITDNNEVYDILSGSTIEIKVTGPRTIVDSLKAGDFTATADFKDLSKTNAVPIDVTINNTRYESKVVITKKSENAMRLSVETLEEKEYEVSVKNVNDIEKNYVVYSTTPEVDKINITAPVSVHKKLGKIILALSFNGNETADFNYLGSVILYDNNDNVLDLVSNHITLSEAYIKVSGTVYYKKTVNVKCNVTNGLGDGKILKEYKSSMDKVEIVGKKNILDKITEIEVPKEMTVINNNTSEIKIDLNTLLPEGVFVYGESSILEINVVTEDTIKKTISLKVSEIGIKNIPDGYEASVIDKGTIDIIIKGIKDELNSINEANIAPYVNLTGLSEGENRVKVNVILPDGVEVISEVYVNVTLTEKENESETTTGGEPNSESTTSESTTPEDTTEESTTPPLENEND